MINILSVVEQCLPDTDAVSSPAEDDSCHAKKSLFETSQPTTDTTSGLYSDQAKETVADDGIHEDNGNYLVTCCSC